LEKKTVGELVEEAGVAPILDKNPPQFFEVQTKWISLVPNIVVATEETLGLNQEVFATPKPFTVFTRDPIRAVLNRVGEEVAVQTAFFR